MTKEQYITFRRNNIDCFNIICNMEKELEKDILDTLDNIYKTNNMQEREVKITIDQAKIMLEGDNQILRDIALKTFPELNKSKYPMSHDELQKIQKDKRVFWIDDNSNIKTIPNFGQGHEIRHYNCDRNIILTEQRAKELLAFTQLIALRDKWNEIDGFEVNFQDTKNKYCIMSENNNIVRGMMCNISFPLTFKTEETRNLFYETFKDLIEEAKNLI